MGLLTKLRIYFNHGRGINGQHEKAIEYAQLTSTLARELTEELTEIQAARDPMRALVSRVNKNRKE